MRGRIIKGIGGLYYIDTEKGIYECSARGIFRKNKLTPTVGDFVEISILNDNAKKGSIESINDRKNITIRPKTANIDNIVLTFSAKKPDLNYDLLDRFLIMTHYQKIPRSIICINKVDISDAEVIETLKNIYGDIYKLVFVSAITGIGIEQLKAEMNGVTVFAGPSGVGKTSLINCLIPKQSLKTGELSEKISRGRHTTRQVELIKAFGDTYIADTPGFTSLDFTSIQYNELEKYFPEFKPYIGKCRFADCQHINEPDCEVKLHIGKSISKERYNRFISFYKELKQLKIQQ